MKALKMFFTAAILLYAVTVAAQENTYRKEMKLLQSVIQKNFYDSAAGYYKEVVLPKPTDNPYSYLWPVCAMYQAVHEIEKLEKQTDLMHPMLCIIRDYYDSAPPAPGYASYIMKLKGGDRFYDDNQWIGITSMDAYNNNKEAQYLNIGKEMYNYMMTGFDTVLTGGLYWQENRKVSKNTCSNGPGIILALQLYQATKQKTYLDTALLLYNWVNRNLKTSSGLYYDNVNVKNQNITKWIFSYNSGTMLQANLYLYACTGNKIYLQEATAIADSSLTFFYGNGKFRDNYWFNAVLLRGYQHLLKYNKDTKYIKGFQQCLDHALASNKNGQGLFQKDHLVDLVEHAGMLEILARFAWLEKYDHLRK